MNEPLQLLASQPAETLHHNLEYIAQNARRDFVAEALRPGGRSLAGTVEFLYEKEENHNPNKVSGIVDFLDGFEGIERLASECVCELGFKEVKEARDRSYNLRQAVGKYLRNTALAELATILACIPITYVLISNHIENPLAMMISLFSGIPIAAGEGFIFANYFGKKGEEMLGNQKPTEAYDSLHSNASKADEYIRLYKLLEEKGFEAKK